MLSTPKQSKKLEHSNTQVETEENIEATGISVAVKDTIDSMFHQLKETTNIESEIKSPKAAEQFENADLTSLADSRSVRSVKRLSSVTAKQKLEMFKHLPTARKDEYKTYTTNHHHKAANNKHKKSTAKLVNLNVKENKREDSWLSLLITYHKPQNNQSICTHSIFPIYMKSFKNQYNKELNSH